VTERRLCFDEVAELYDRARPGYPSKLVADVVALGGLGTGARILEIGCGTGQATRSFASLGFHVRCLEPGPALARIARERLASFPHVEVVGSSFETWPLEPEAFDLVFSAQAFHWIAPEIPFAKSAAALRPGGGLAVFGNVPMWRDSAVRSAIDAAYARHAPSLGGGATPASWYAEDGALETRFTESGKFCDVTVRSYPWSQAYGVEEYLDLLRTHSDHRALPPLQHEALLSEIGRALETHGGSLHLAYEAHLCFARTRS
jgi:SAM-dependent methyltransferase